jgi:glucokinase
MAAPLLLGLEIGGTKLQLGIGHGDGRLLALARLNVDPQAGAYGIQSQIKAALGPLCERVGKSPSDLQAAGVGFGGPVDARAGVVTRSMQVGGWANFPLAHWLSTLLGGCPVNVQNDADTAGLAEARFGAAKGLSPVLYVTIGSGIGGGLIIDGQIYRGAGAGAVEIGHLLVDLRDAEPLVRLVGLEDVASGWAIARACCEHLEGLQRAGQPLPPWVVQWAQSEPRLITCVLVARAAEAGDPLALQVIANARYALARALAHAVTLLAPRRIILGGGVSLMAPKLWIEPLRQKVETWVFPIFRGTFDLVTADLGEDVVVQGALSLALDAYQTHSAGFVRTPLDQ